MRSTYYFGLLFSLLLLAACGDKSIPLDDKGREDFYTFYDQFYADSAFQLARIEFPLIGKNPVGGEKNFYWTEENWKRQVALDFEDDKYKCFITDMEDMIHEKIIIENTFVVIRYYNLIGNKWHLTSYSGIKDVSSLVKNKPVDETIPTVETIPADSSDPDAPTIELMN